MVNAGQFRSRQSPPGTGRTAPGKVVMDSGMTKEQFGVVVEQYQKLVYTICYQMVRDHLEAQNLDQETFLAAFTHIDRCREEEMKPWLCRIAANKAKDHLKSAYVRRVIENMTEDALAAMETAIPTYARKIQEKIDGLERIHRAHQFKKWLDSGKIVCRDSYALPQVITPAESIDSIPYSLYEAEKDDMNQEERNLIDVVIGLGNVKWWHRIIERKGFRINGNINHYPDFMIMTHSGRLVLVEFKGDDRDNSDSKMKLELGRQWQAQAGTGYRYFMVFRSKILGIEGAYTMDQFAEIMKEL